MSSNVLPSFPLWYTRCPVPTASGLAYAQGWLSKRYEAWGASLGILQDAPADIARHHYDHDLPGLIREGGNVPAIVARSTGAPTRLIGLTWIDERQIIVTRPGTALTPSRLAGLRIAVPDWASERHASHHRAMALAGFEAALCQGGASLAAVQWIEVPVADTLPPGRLRAARGTTGWVAVQAVADGRADAAYVKGSDGLAVALAAGLVVAIELDQLPERRLRVNNGTPRPLTVHEELLQHRPEWVVAFLEESLRAATWAVDNEDEVRRIIVREAGGDAAAVQAAYGKGFHTGFAPSLSSDRLDLLALQIEFLARQGFLSGPVRIEDWVATQPLEAARSALA